MPGRRRRRLPGTAQAAAVRAAWWLGLPFAAVVVAQDECVTRDGQQSEDPCEGLAESACTAEACCWGARRHGGEGCRDDLADVVAFLGVLGYAALAFCGCGAVWTICRRISEQQERNQEEGRAHDRPARIRGPRRPTPDQPPPPLVPDMSTLPVLGLGPPQVVSAVAVDDGDAVSAVANAEVTAVGSAVPWPAGAAGGSGSSRP